MSALETLRTLTTFRCEPAWTERKLHAPTCLEEYRDDLDEAIADATKQGWQDRDRAIVVGRCWSCDHESAMHQPEGCWYAVTNGTEGKDLVCPCSEPKPVTP